VKGYVDISGGDLNLQNGAFTMYNGLTSSAYFSIQNNGKFYITHNGALTSISLENLKILKFADPGGPTLGDLQDNTVGISHNLTATDDTLIGNGGLTVTGTRFKNNNYALFMSDVSINGVLNVIKDASLNSKLFVNNDVSFNSKLAVMLDTSLNSRLFVNNDVSFNSKLRVMLDVSLNSRLFVNNDASFNSKLSVMLDASLNSRLFVNNDVSFNSKLAVMLDTSLNSRLFVNNDVSFNSKLRVMLDVSLNSRLFVNNDVSFNSKLMVNQDVSLNSRLFVNNDVSFNSKLMVNQDVSLNSRLFVNNDVSFNSKLMVMQDASLNSRLFVNNDVSFNSKLFVKNFVSIGKSSPLMSLDISYADGIRLPTGTTNERPIKVVGTNSFQTQTGTTISVTDKSLYVGAIRYNTTNSQFEGFGPGDSWGSLGGVINVAQNTKIMASSPNPDSSNNELIFFTAPTGNLVTGAATERMRIAANGDVSMNDKLFVRGDVSFNSNFTVVGNVKIDNTLTMKINVLTNGGANQGAATIITPNTSIVEINGIGTSFNNYSLADGYFDGQTIKIVSDQLNASGLNLYGNLYFDQSLNRCTPIIFKNSYQSFDAIWSGGVWIVTSWNGVIFSNSNIMFGTSNSGDVEIIPAGKLYVNGRTTIVNDITLNSKLFVTGDVSFNSRLSVLLDSSFNANLFVGGSIVNTALTAALNLKANLAGPTFTGTVGGITSAMVGLGNVDNTSDANKPVSTATTTALNLKANLAGPTFTGTVVSAGDISLNSKLSVLLDSSFNANLFVGGSIVNTALTAALNLKANLAGPTFTGTVGGITSAMVGLGNVNNTSDANKPVSTATTTALNLKANIAGPTFTGTVSGITSAMVGLGNVNNTSDANKPVSTATTTALNLKANIAGPTFTGTVSGITSAMVGLGNVNNTSDANKPVSTATTTALNLKANLAGPTFTGLVISTNDVSMNSNLFVGNALNVNGSTTFKVVPTSTATQPEASDSTTKIPNTAWVQSAILASDVGIKNPYVGDFEISGNFYVNKGLMIGQFSEFYETIPSYQYLFNFEKNIKNYGTAQQLTFSQAITYSTDCKIGNYSAIINPAALSSDFYSNETIPFGSNFSICFWVKFTSIADTNKIIQFFYSANDKLTIRFNGTKISCSVNGSGLMSTTTDFVIDTWYHIGITISGTIGIIYVNGSQNVSDNVNSLISTPKTLYIASDPESTSYLNILIDQLIFDNTVFTATNVSDIYNSNFKLYLTTDLNVNGDVETTRVIGKNGGVASHIAWHNSSGAFDESSSVFYGIGTISNHLTFSANQTIAQASAAPSMKLSSLGNLTAYGFKSFGNDSTSAEIQPDFNGDGLMNHNLLLVSTKQITAPGTTPYAMSLGVDYATGCGYINAAGNSRIQPVCLQTRGGGVGIGKTTITANYVLDVNGDVQANTYNALSDYRIKENVMILDASFNVDVLNPVTYNLKSSGKQDIGFIAHEVQEFYPFLVNGVKDGPDNQSINYNGLIGILTKEIKDLKKEMRIVREVNTKLNEDFSKLASEMSVLRDIVQELMPL
jgi:hypothetical protein